MQMYFRLHHNKKTKKYGATCSVLSSGRGLEAWQAVCLVNRRFTRDRRGCSARSCRVLLMEETSLDISLGHSIGVVIINLPRRAGILSWTGKGCRSASRLRVKTSHYTTDCLRKDQDKCNNRKDSHISQRNEPDGVDGKVGLEHQDTGSGELAEPPRGDNEWLPGQRGSQRFVGYLIGTRNGNTSASKGLWSFAMSCPVVRALMNDKNRKLQRPLREKDFICWKMDVLTFRVPTKTDRHMS